ncbi:hypothetical protein EFN19_10860 [Propionibacterium freudenreichii]|nr:hypothetical protein [Propionibacterium freudenreichii]
MDLGLSSTDSATESDGGLGPRTSTDPYAPGGPWAYAETKRGRIFKIQSAWVHPDSGATLITKERVEQAVRRKGNLRTAWIDHDRDTYSKEDVAENPRAVLGQLKPAHVHVVEERRNSTSVAAVARAYGLRPEQVEVAKGRGAFLDCCEYLTHEHAQQQASGKHLYDDGAIHANFDLRGALDHHRAQRTGLARSSEAIKLSAVDRLAMMIQNEGLTLMEAEALDPLAYNRGEPRLVRARSTYLAKQPQPPFRMNIYLFGEGGTGKDALARAMARQLVPGDWIPGVKEPFFILGGENVTWEGYDGQLAVIIEEGRPASLVKSFGRKELLTFLNPFPARQKLNIKNSSVLPVNTFTIITGPDDYETFLDGLAGEYIDRSGTRFTAENKNQTYRRIPMIIPVRDDEFDLMVNKGFVDNTSEYREYYYYKGIRQNIRQVLRRVKGIEDPDRRVDVQLAIEAKQVQPILAQHERIVSSVSTEYEDPDTLVEEFSGLGEFVSEEERAASRADALARARAQADGVTAGFLAAGLINRTWVAEREGLPPVIYSDGNPDMSLWDASTGTYNGQPPLPLSRISPEFKSTD